MGAPEHVPSTTARVRSYTSAPRRTGSWLADRPGELAGRQPEGGGLGSPGPDQGYVLTLAREFAGRLELGEGEHEVDALAGASAVALKRASLFGRAPVIHDLTAGLEIWHWFDAAPPSDLDELRRDMFKEAHHPHHYPKLRRIADVVGPEVLARPLDAIVADARSDWRSVIRA